MQWAVLHRAPRINYQNNNQNEYIWWCHSYATRWCSEDKKKQSNDQVKGSFLPHQQLPAGRSKCLYCSISLHMHHTLSVKGQISKTVITRNNDSIGNLFKCLKRSVFKHSWQVTSCSSVIALYQLQRQKSVILLHHHKIAWVFYWRVFPIQIEGLKTECVVCCTERKAL